MLIGRHRIQAVRIWWQNLPLRVEITIIALCVAILGAVVFYIYAKVEYVARAQANCMVQGATVVQHTGPNAECVGITDGAFSFDPALKGVEQEIMNENQKITSAHPTNYVSIVMLLPISPNSGSIMSITNVLEQLRGAYAAQYYANRNDLGGAGVTPYIQLLIGNDGNQADQWQGAVGIIKNAVSSEHVAAVAGLGVSLDTTRSAAVSLTSAGIPVFGATITSDDFDNIQNLVRVAPSNASAVPVIVSYAKARYTRAVIVEDQNTGDIYDSTLVTGLEKFADTGHQFVGTEPYDTTQRDQPQPEAAGKAAEAVVQDRLSLMPADICVAEQSGPAVVLFAGRGSDLAQLITYLKDRPCTNVPITIMSGDDVTNMLIDPGVRAGLDSGVTLDYVGIANPDEWNQGTDAAAAAGRKGFQVFKQGFDSLFPGGALTDGNSMMAYDAVLTGESAVRLTKQQQPQPYAVDGMLGALQGAHTVLGSSGPLAFDADYTHSTDASDPVDKPVPVLRIGQNGDTQFLALYWPSGEPISP